jgi:hypothetical protein
MSTAEVDGFGFAVATVSHVYRSGRQLGFAVATVPLTIP